MEHIINFESDELIALADLFKTAYDGPGLNNRQQQLAIKLIPHFQQARTQKQLSQRTQFTREEAYEILGGEPMA